MSKHLKRGFQGLALLPLVAVAGTAYAQEAAPSVDTLDQRIKVLERQLEIQKEESDAKAKDTATVSANEKGFSIKSAKGDYEFKFRGLLQADGRWFTDDKAPRSNDGFLLRRVEPTFELTLGKSLFFRIQPNFAPDSSQTSDAYGEWRIDPAFYARAGKFKAPVVLENLQASAAIAFNERGFPNELGPNRDYGVQFGGSVLSSTTSYALGIFNGAPDGRDGVQQSGTAGDNRKEVAARLFTEPFKNSPGFFQGLGFGIGGSTGEKQGTNDITQVKYRTPGQNTFFAYSTGVSYDGTETRISPQAYYYRNSFGLLAEYIDAKQEVLKGTTHAKLDNKAYQAVANYFLTGEDASYGGLIKPKNAIDKGGIGAWELVARYGSLDVDDDAFTGAVYADAKTAASKATTWAAGTNWYPVNNLKIALTYSQTSFDGGASEVVGGATHIIDREDEKLFFTRFQIAF